MIKGCENPEWNADGYCDDVSNNEACFFDGGDCCGSNVNTAYCTVCQCLEVGGGGSGGTTTSSVTTIGENCNQGWINDGGCDDINNNFDCNFDGGDCCGSDVNTAFCTACQCLEVGGGGSGGTTTSSVTTIGENCNQGWINDGFCDDINNNFDCNFDGGDCCGSNVIQGLCIQCQCLE